MWNVYVACVSWVCGIVLLSDIIPRIILLWSVQECKTVSIAIVCQVNTDKQKKTIHGTFPCLAVLASSYKFDSYLYKTEKTKKF